jgi:hypothetical protein
MAQIDVNVSWREIPLLSHVTLSDVSDSGGFLATAAPMPVGTMLILSPVRHAELVVPARVTATVEGNADDPGMQLTFEAAGDALLSFTEGSEQPDATESAAAGAEADEADEDIPVVTIEAEPQQVRDSGIAPVVSGEILLGDQAYGVFPRAQDPDAPDKVIVEVEADSARSEESESAEEEPESAEEDPESAAESDEDKAAGEDAQAAAAADTQADASDDRRKRRKGKGKRKKKKGK